jgi:hypothetical protein
MILNPGIFRGYRDPSPSKLRFGITEKLRWVIGKIEPQNQNPPPGAAVPHECGRDEEAR